MTYEHDLNSVTVYYHSVNGSMTNLSCSGLCLINDSHYLSLKIYSIKQIFLRMERQSSICFQKWTGMSVFSFIMQKLHANDFSKLYSALFLAFNYTFYSQP